jgi:hypothetical protein
MAKRTKKTQQALPEPATISSASLTIRIPQSTLGKLYDRSRRDGVSLSRLTVLALELYLLKD